jgi:hypothetical protein
MRLSQLRDVTRPLSLDFDSGHKLNFSYYPNRYTPEHESMTAKAATDPTVGGFLKRMIMPLLASWDCEDEFNAATMAKGGKHKALENAEATILDQDDKPVLAIPAGDGVADALYWDDKTGQLFEACSVNPDLKVLPATKFAVIPITELGLHRMPIPVLLMMMEKMTEDLRPEKQRLTTSEPSSF